MLTKKYFTNGGVIVIKSSCWKFSEACFGPNDNPPYSERYYLVAKNFDSSTYGTLIIFMMNPSYAGSKNGIIDLNQTDRTVDSILKKSSVCKKYHEIIILNNIPTIEKDSSKLEINAISLCRNTHYIKKYINEKFKDENTESYDLLVGTGNIGAGMSNRTVYEFYCENMDQLANSQKCGHIYCYGLNTSIGSRGQAAVHPSRGRINDKKCEVCWKDHRLTLIENEHISNS